MKYIKVFEGSSSYILDAAINQHCRDTKHTIVQQSCSCAVGGEGFGRKIIYMIVVTLDDAET
jgi:hypothetical protein